MAGGRFIHCRQIRIPTPFVPHRRPVTLGCKRKVHRQIFAERLAEARIYVQRLFPPARIHVRRQSFIPRIALVRIVHTRRIHRSIVQPPAVLQLMFLRHVELPGVDALRVFGVKVHTRSVHFADKTLAARRMIPRKLRARLQPERRLIVQLSVVQPRFLIAQRRRRLCACGILVIMAGVVTSIINKIQGMIFGELVTGAEAERMRMVPSVPPLVVPDRISLTLRLLPVARLFVGRMVALTVRMRIKEIRRKLSSVI